MTDCNAFTGPDTIRCQTAMLSQGPMPPDTILPCFHRALYHQMPPDAFTGPDTTRCQTAMLSQVPIPPDATRCNPIPPDA